jgi:hypothetical protein
MSIAGSQLIVDFSTEPTTSDWLPVPPEGPPTEPPYGWININSKIQNTTGAGQGARALTTGVFADIKYGQITTAEIIKAKIRITTNIEQGSGDALGPMVLDDENDQGYVLSLNGSNGSIRKRTTNSGRGSTLGSSFTVAVTANSEYELWYNRATGELKAVVNDVEVYSWTDTDYQESDLVIGFFSDPQNSNNRRIGAFGADISDAAVTVDFIDTPIDVNIAIAAGVTTLGAVLTTGNAPVYINSDSNPPITPDSVDPITGDSYQIIFTVPDAYADLPYSATGYSVVFDTPDGQAVSDPVGYYPEGYSTGAANFVTATSVPGALVVAEGQPPLEVGNQIEYETAGGQIALTDDLEIIFTGENPDGVTFLARVWTESDGWGGWTLQTLSDGSGGAELPYRVVSFKVVTPRSISAKHIKAH